MKITTLLTTAGDCPHDNICPSIHDLDTDPGNRYVISKVSTAGERAAFAGELRPGDLLGWMPAGFVPAGNVMLERTAGVVDPRLDPDRQYVITPAVTDRAALHAFRPLIGHDEQLGVVAVRELATV